MPLAACLITNEPPGLKQHLLQARIDGKSWKQIAEEFDYGSPGAARTAFKKATGLKDTTIKGTKLSNLIAEVGPDNLGTVMKTKASKTFVPNSSTFADDVAIKGKNVGAVGDALDDPVMAAAFPDKWKTKLFLNEPDDVSQYLTTHKFLKKKEAYFAKNKVILKHGKAKADEVAKMLKNGDYYGSIKNATGVDFADIDTMNWNRMMDQFKGDVWKAYSGKPTSEYGFKQVQDLAWSLRKKGVSWKDIETNTGIPSGVLKLIKTDKWKLPAKGSANFVTSSVGSVASAPSATAATASASATASSSYTSSVTKLIGEKGKFKNMSPQQANRWAASIGKDATQAEIQAVRDYTGSLYRSINNGHRGKSTLTKRAKEASDDIQRTMRELPDDFTLYRGVGQDTFPGGIPKAGDTFADPAFMSASYGNRAAFSGHYQLVMDLPKGFKARPLQTVSNFGTSEREILLGRNSQFIVTGTEEKNGTIFVYMRGRLQ